MGEQGQRSRELELRLLEERRTRPDPWYKHSPGHIGICNVSLRVREAAAKP